MVLRGKHPQPLVDPADDDDKDKEEHDLGPVSGPRVLSLIELVKNPGVSWYMCWSYLQLDLSVVVCGYPCNALGLAQYVNQPRFPELLCQSLWEILNPDSPKSPDEIPIDECLHFGCSMNVYHSTVACFYALSDLCSTGGMYHERICSTPNCISISPLHFSSFDRIWPCLPCVQTVAKSEPRS